MKNFLAFVTVIFLFISCDPRCYLFKEGAFSESYYLTEDGQKTPISVKDYNYLSVDSITGQSIHFCFRIPVSYLQGLDSFYLDSSYCTWQETYGEKNPSIISVSKGIWKKYDGKKPERVRYADAERLYSILEGDCAVLEFDYSNSFDIDSGLDGFDLVVMSNVTDRAPLRASLSFVIRSSNI